MDITEIDDFLEYIFFTSSGNLRKPAGVVFSVMKVICRDQVADPEQGKGSQRFKKAKTKLRNSYQNLSLKILSETLDSSKITKNNLKQYTQKINNFISNTIERIVTTPCDSKLKEIKSTFEFKRIGPREFIKHLAAYRNRNKQRKANDKKDDFLVNIVTSKIKTKYINEINKKRILDKLKALKDKADQEYINVSEATDILSKLIKIAVKAGELLKDKKIEKEYEVLKMQLTSYIGAKSGNKIQNEKVNKNSVEAKTSIKTSIKEPIKKTPQQSETHQQLETQFKPKLEEAKKLVTDLFGEDITKWDENIGKYDKLYKDIYAMMSPLENGYNMLEQEGIINTPTLIKKEIEAVQKTIFGNYEINYNETDPPTDAQKKLKTLIKIGVERRFLGKENLGTDIDSLLTDQQKEELEEELEKINQPKTEKHKPISLQNTKNSNSTRENKSYFTQLTHKSNDEFEKNEPKTAEERLENHIKSYNIKDAEKLSKVLELYLATNSGKENFIAVMKKAKENGIKFDKKDISRGFRSYFDGNILNEKNFDDEFKENYGITYVDVVG